MEKRAISTQTLRRLPVYLGYLRQLTARSVSATTIAGALNLSEIQVRKDLAAVTEGGRPGVGYETRGLISDLEHYLGYDRMVAAVLVGAGNLGRAIMGYSGFAGCGLDIVSAFDRDPKLAGTTVGGKPVGPMEELKDVCRVSGARLGVITVPEASAQEACDALVDSGIKAIWNFAPAHLSAPEDVILQNENLVASLTVLSRRLAERLSIKGDKSNTESGY